MAERMDSTAFEKAPHRFRPYSISASQPFIFSLKQESNCPFLNSVCEMNVQLSLKLQPACDGFHRLDIFSCPDLRRRFFYHWCQRGIVRQFWHILPQQSMDPARR